MAHWETSHTVINVMLGFLKRYCLRGLLISLACSLFFSPAFGQGKRHIVAYGGINDRYLAEIAQNCDVLIASKISLSQASVLRRLNPKIVILKYQNAIYVNNTDQNWEIIDRNESWFTHSTLTNERIQQNRFNAYLMNLSVENMRSFRSKAIIDQTPDYYDGIFLDDCHDNYPRYFSSVGLIPKEHDLIKNWGKYVTKLLIALRTEYFKLLIINGPFDNYLQYVDGCMMESFVHSNQDSDEFFRKPSQVITILDRVEQLKKQGKLVLLQSGTLSEGSRSNEMIFNYCFVSYLLVASDKTSFNFKLGRGYYYQGMPQFKQLNSLSMGPPLESYKINKRNIDTKNYLNNGSFKRGFSDWNIRRGNPRIERIESTGNMAVHFSGYGSGHSDMIETDFIPVTALNDYTISLECKSISNLQGSAGWKKLGLIGRFYDKDKTVLTGAYDLQFDHGSYNWRSFDVSFRSPKSAKYFKFSIGFIGDGSGEGLVTNISFTLSKNIHLLLSRRFANGIAILNPTPNPSTMYCKQKDGYITPVIIDGLTGRFLACDDIRAQ